MRKYYSREVQLLDGTWVALYQGREWIRSFDGRLLLTPNEPTFHSKERAEAWVRGE